MPAHQEDRDSDVCHEEEVCQRDCEYTEQLVTWQADCNAKPKIYEKITS